MLQRCLDRKDKFCQLDKPNELKIELYRKTNMLDIIRALHEIVMCSVFKVICNIKLTNTKFHKLLHLDIDVFLV